MKRFWLFALFVAGSLAVLTAPVFAKGEEGSDDSSTEDMNQAMGSLSARVGDVEKILGLKFFGDVRTRLDWRTQTQSDPATIVTATGKYSAAPGSGAAPIVDLTRGRYRARLGAMKTMGDFKAAMRIATGANNNPNSENNTFDTGFINPSIGIDQAYLTYTPNFLSGHMWLTAGKMPNPLTVSPISWDPDIMPEGIALSLSSNAQNNTTLRAVYFDLISNTGGGQTYYPGVLPTVAAGSYYSNNVDEYVADVQLEQLLQLDTNTSVQGTIGFEYISSMTALANGAVGAPPTGTLAGLNNAQVGADGMIWNYGRTIPDVQNIEAIVVIKNKVGDVPLKWTLHATDNLNSFNIPATGNPLANAAATQVVGGDGVSYTPQTNQYAFYAGVNIGEIKQKNDFAGLLAAGYLEPNCTLGFLTDDDPGNNNREYLKGNIAFGIEDNVQLSITSWAVSHVYYAYLRNAYFVNGTVNTNGIALNNSLGGTSSNPEFITFFDCMATF